MPGYERDRVLQAAQAILDRGEGCMFEVCVNVPAQRWEGRSLILNWSAEEVAAAVQGEIAIEPDLDARLSGCDRRTLARSDGGEPDLVYVADVAACVTELPAPTVVAKPNRRFPMLVRDGMNPIVVTAGPDHTLREAARRMTAHGVGAAVVIDDELGGPCIITERDILHSNGVGQSIDTELVRSHLTSEVVYAAADWSLEQAAQAMVRGGFRHIIVLNRSDVVGILSMRDIVRCWTGEGASCDVPAGALGGIA
jgi:CBS domain-containing protein